MQQVSLRPLMNHGECVPCFLLFPKYRGRTGSWCPWLYHSSLLNQAELCLYSCRDFCLHCSYWGSCSWTSWLECLGIGFGFPGYVCVGA